MANGNGNGTGERRSGALDPSPARGGRRSWPCSGSWRRPQRGQADRSVASSRRSRRATSRASVVATGKIQPLTKVEIKSKASGIVKRLFVDYGDRVKEGQVLAELDREQLEAAVREARANLLAARGLVRAQQDRGRGAGPALPEVRRSSGLAEALRRRPHRAVAPRGRRQGLPDGAQQADRGQEPGGGSPRRGREGPGRRSSGTRRTSATRRSRARWTASCSRATWRSATRSARSSSSARRRRCVMTLGDVSEVYVLGKVDEADIGTRLPRPARAHRGRVVQGQVVRGQGHEDLAARRGEGQRDHVRGARLDPATPAAS